MRCSHGVSFEDRCPQCLQEGLMRVVAQKNTIHTPVLDRLESANLAARESFLLWGTPNTPERERLAYIDEYLNAYRKLKEENEKLEAENRHLKAKMAEIHREYGKAMSCELEGERETNARLTYKIGELEARLKEANHYRDLYAEQITAIRASHRELEKKLAEAKSWNEKYKQQLDKTEAKQRRREIEEAYSNGHSDCGVGILCDAIKYADYVVGSGQLEQEPAASAVPVHQWRARNQNHWQDATKEFAYQRVDEFYEARTLYTAPQAAPAPEMTSQERLFCGVNRAEFHDRAWWLYNTKTYDDTQLAKVNIHTIRAVFDAVFDSIAAAPSSEQKGVGEIVVTTNESGECVAVTRQNEEGEILKVLWQAELKDSIGACQPRYKLNERAEFEKAFAKETTLSPDCSVGQCCWRMWQARAEIGKSKDGGENG